MAKLGKVFDNLDARETAYVLARSDSVSNSEALRKCGFSQGWLNKRDIEGLNARAATIREDKAIRASMLLAEAVEEAAKVKVAGLKVRDDRIKQSVATEILDRELGKVSQSLEVSGKDGGAVIVKWDAENND